MPISLITQLLVTFGPSAVSLIDKLIEKWATGSDTPVSPAEWQELRNAASQTAKDRMILMLAKANIDINSDQGKALIAAAS